MRKFQAQIDATMTQLDEKFKPQLKHLEAESKENPTGEHSFNYVFQINDDYSWLGGALPLNLGFSPYEHFEITPARTQFQYLLPRRKSRVRKNNTALFTGLCVDPEGKASGVHSTL